jgi:hypothetical protein
MSSSATKNEVLTLVLQEWAQKTWTKRNPDDDDAEKKDTSTLETNIIKLEERKESSSSSEKKELPEEIELRPIPPRHIKSGKAHGLR